MSRIPIVVIKDFPAGTVVVRNDLEWNVEFDAPRQGIAYTNWFNDPQHIFFRGINRFPKVEYQDPITKNWVQLKPIYDENQFSIPGTAYFDLLGADINLFVKDGVSPSWLSDNPPVRLTY
jgi:hypothetical protein